MMKQLLPRAGYALALLVSCLFPERILAGAFIVSDGQPQAEIVVSEQPVPVIRAAAAEQDPQTWARLQQYEKAAADALEVHDYARAASAAKACMGLLERRY